MRFDDHAVDRPGAEAYLRERAHQLLIDGFHPERDELEMLVADGQECGLRAFALDRHGVAHQSVYVYAPYRGRGLALTALVGGAPVVTTPGCRLEGFLTAKGIPFVVAASITAHAEYLAIEEDYGRRTAQRSGVPLMHHIDEGLAVLQRIGAAEETQLAFCLHPLLQEDSAHAANLERVRTLTSPQVLALALECRRVANAALSPRQMASSAEIELSAVPEVNQLLVADKVQNRKDFILNHRGSHPRSDALDLDFRRWLERLQVNESRFAALFEDLQATARPVPRPIR
jgi:GNAT superfamily N-acetyltransferase